MKEDVELLKLDGAIMKEDEVVEAVHPQERSSVGETPPKVSHLPTFPTEPQEEEEELIVADEAWMAKRKVCMDQSMSPACTANWGVF